MKFYASSGRAAANSPLSVWEDDQTIKTTRMRRAMKPVKGGWLINLFNACQLDGKDLHL
jgi:hypothetical protein